MKGFFEFVRSLEIFKKVEMVEHKVFYPIVRIAGFITAAILLIAMIVSLIFAISYRFDLKKESKKLIISFEEIAANFNSGPAKPDLAYPGNIAEIIFDDEDAYEYFSNMLAKLKTKEEKEAFLMNMSDIIYEAERKEPDRIYRYIEEYARLVGVAEDDKGDDIMNQVLNALKPHINPIVEKVETTVERTVRWVAIFGIGCLFLLFITVTLLLLLLSIERNTRKDTAHSKENHQED